MKQMSRNEKVQLIKNEIMTLDKVIEELQVSRQYIYRLMKEKKLVPIIRGSGANIYLRDDVVAYAEASLEKLQKRIELVDKRKI